MLVLTPSEQVEAAARANERVRMARTLTQVGLRMIERLDAAQAAGGEDAPAAGEAALAFNRLSRAVRLCLALEERLEAQARWAARTPIGLREPEPQTEEERRLEARKDQVYDAVAEAVEAAVPDHEVESVLAEASERLDERTEPEEILRRPIREVAAEICAELEVPFDPGQWPGEDEGGDEPPASTSSADAGRIDEKRPADTPAPPPPRMGARVEEAGQPP